MAYGAQRQAIAAILGIYDARNVLLEASAVLDELLCRLLLQVGFGLGVGVVGVIEQNARGAIHFKFK